MCFGQCGQSPRPADADGPAERTLRIVGNALHFRTATGQHDLTPGRRVETHARERRVDFRHQLVQPFADDGDQRGPCDLAAVRIGTCALARHGHVAMRRRDLDHLAEVAAVLHGRTVKAFDALSLAAANAEG